MAFLEKYIDDWSEVREQTQVSDIWSRTDDLAAFAVCDLIDREVARAMQEAMGGEPVAILSAYHGPNGPEVSVGVIDPKRFPVVNDRTTTYPLRPPRPRGEGRGGWGGGRRHPQPHADCRRR